jgi:hypothetical protein
MNKLLPSLMLIAALVFLSPEGARAQTSPLKALSDHSVEMVTQTAGQTISTVMYKSKDKTRVETKANGMESVSIMREDLKKMYMLMPAQKMYMEMDLNPAAAAADMTTPKGDMKWEKLGSETINTVACDKYKVTTTYEGKTNEMIYYIDAQGRPARTEMTTGDQKMVVDYKNWKEASQDASLFEVPAGFSKMPGAGGS